MANVSIDIGTVVDIESTSSKDGYDGLRIRAKLMQEEDSDSSTLPWAFPLLPKVFQSIPKKGEAVFLITTDGNSRTDGQRYYIGPIISQPQYNDYCEKDKATTLLGLSKLNPIEKISNEGITHGSFPNSEDIAIIGRGGEDIALKYDRDTGASEIDIRAGIRKKSTIDNNPNLIGNIIFNGADPAYIQLKYKNGLSDYPQANSIINIVADRINLISNKDKNVSDKIHDTENLIADDKDVMSDLQAVPLGNNLYNLLMIMRGCILHHVHPSIGKEQCGDWGGDINKLLTFDWSSLLSKHVKTS